MSNSSRRIKWHPTPPPAPSHFPRRRRTRRQQTTHHHQNNTLLLMHASFNGNQEALPIEEKNNSESRRERVEEEREEFEEEKWRVEAEMLRAECNLLRMERELALKKLEKNTVKMEKTLRSAVQTLVSGREKIFEGKNANAVLEEEIEDLEEKLDELHKTSRIKDSQTAKCSNFDKKAWILQQKLGELSHDCTISNSKAANKSNHNAEKKKMKGASKGMLMLDRGEDDNNSIITANSSVASSASTSKRLEFPEFSCFSTGHHLYQEEVRDENKCSGRCKAIVRKIVEQVRAETEQCSQMQEMLVLVRLEMEDLQASRHFWQNRARHADYEIQSLSQDVEEWREKAVEHENKAKRLELQVSLLKEEMQKCKVQDKQLGAPLSLAKQLANEKRLLLRRLLEEDGRRKPFKDIGNSSSLPLLPLHHTPS